ncbi:unnamed protein product [Orchesella dallaii]|uniref:Fe2OG dioxygenase domain-containing protein n=1 Tax=Orchesella dallaii TaxID=48710 RepID=A0ABP1QE67_9HEXA
MPVESLPVVNVEALLLTDDNSNNQKTNERVQQTSQQLLDALVEWGFLYISGHCVDINLQNNLEAASREFFNLPLEVKQQINMKLGKHAWRGYFPPGDELTSGIPDSKEGIYFGTELADNHPKVVSETPLHGSNLWPCQYPELKTIVLQYMNAMEQLGHALMRGLAIGLGLDEKYFQNSFGKDPTLLFRIFNYPPSSQKVGWGVGEHTDYGFLTILKTDNNPGLEVLSPTLKWIEVPFIPNTFIINIGDQLEIATNGLLKATPHRVRIQREENRLSWPFFFDPDWDALLRRVDLTHWNNSNEWPSRKPGKRWDGKDLKTMQNQKYGDYLLDKVSRCFPHLFKAVVT